MNEVKENRAIRNNLITFTTPLHIGYRVSRGAQLTRFTGTSVHVKDAGIEDLTVTGGSDGAIRFESAAYSWLKNVEDTLWLGEGVAVDHSFRIELRDSYIHDGAWSAPRRRLPSDSLRSPDSRREQHRREGNKLMGPLGRRGIGRRYTTWIMDHQ